MTWKQMLAYITGSVNKDLLCRIEYLLEENRVLRTISKPGRCPPGKTFPGLSGKNLPPLSMTWMPATAHGMAARRLPDAGGCGGVPQGHSRLARIAVDSTS